MEDVKDAAKRNRDYLIIGYVLFVSLCARYEDKKKEQEWKKYTRTSYNR